MVYLDFNATTPVDPRVLDSMLPLFSREFGNPSSSHAFGRRARSCLEEARRNVADAIGASPGEIVFTSGGTESNHLALIGAAMARGRGHIVTSAVEHPSVLQPCQWLSSRGFELTVVEVDGTGRIELSDLERALRPETILVSVMHANNEVGTVQPVEDIGRIARDRGIVFHTDAAQTVGKIPVNVEDLGADLLTVVGHKVYGPKGIGALYVRPGTSLEPLLRGGGQERGIRPGTENTAAVVGLGVACRLAAAEGWGAAAGKAAEEFWKALQVAVPGCRRNGHPSFRLPNTVHVTFPGLPAQQILQKLDGEVAASAGSACHSDKDMPSGVLHAMGFSQGDALSSIRFSVGKDTSREDVTRAVERIGRVCRDADRHRSFGPGRP